MNTSAAPARVKYAELVCDWLVELGYTHCFFVAGGNIMHLLDGARSRFTCVPVVHEVAAGIAVEYFNETDGEGRAFAMVTAGPGLTNIVTAMAGAWLESRELLVVGGQVKSSDLATDGIRQRGIQEIDGVALAAPVAVVSERIEAPIGQKRFRELVAHGRQDRPGPVFLELCLDAQGAPVDPRELNDDGDIPVFGPSEAHVEAGRHAVASIVELMHNAQRPVWLLGGGVSRHTAAALRSAFDQLGVAIMTTWNGADRIGADSPVYFGRPNTWGQRYPNALLAQADLIVAFGTRLGLQQTGFNWQEWGLEATVVQIDVDEAELRKGHPRVDVPLCADANELLRGLCGHTFPSYAPWLEQCAEVKALLPVNETWNETGEGFLSPYEFYQDLSRLAVAHDVLIPCSSGGANSVAMQAIEQKAGQAIVTDKGLASMGYGLSGAIGAAFGHRDKRVWLVEGDGGFIQNLQELATVAVNDLDIKIFIFANNGYGSIRMTQKNYFGGAYLGCDTNTGLGFPEWAPLFQAFGIGLTTLSAGWTDDPEVRALLDAKGPQGFIVPIDPLQTYWPKITSRVTESGSMESQPLHRMSPDLPDEVAARVFRHS